MKVSLSSTADKVELLDYFEKVLLGIPLYAFLYVYSNDGLFVWLDIGCQTTESHTESYLTF